MKIQYKAASIMTLFGAVIVTLLSVGYDMYSHRIVIGKELKRIQNISDEVARHMESHLREKATVAITVASAPSVRDALLKSNSEFATLPVDERREETERGNRQWRGTADINAPLVQAHMTNPVAEYLRYQQTILPGEYGEIFLTNRYGVMIATTSKLTTLAHAHKYWWLACYDDGRGRIFLDDRGFDTSVRGYVLGVVIPIRDKNKVIGILKSNVNIMGSLTDVVQEFTDHTSGRMKIVRTSGLVVAERGVPPLSTRINEALVKILAHKESGSTIIAENNENQLVAYAPIKITMGSEEIGFSGSQKSINHIKGNKNDAWHVVITLDKEKALETAHKTTQVIIIVGILFTLVSAVVALIFCKLAARPIVELASTAQALGLGHLETRACAHSNDEIGSLAKSLNRMAKNLQETMTSRDELTHEIEQRKRVEERLLVLSSTDELTGAYNRRAFNEYLHTNIARATRHGEMLSMLMLDIDHFKNVNDSHGHDVGDLVLGTLCYIIRENIRAEDILARWGGEEFTILLPQTGKDAALQLAERLREHICGHAFPEVGQITVSIGHTDLQLGDTSDSFVKRADNTLYRAKRRGRNIVISCST